MYVREAGGGCMLGRQEVVVCLGGRRWVYVRKAGGGCMLGRQEVAVC